MVIPWACRDGLYWNNHQIEPKPLREFGDFFCDRRMRLLDTFSRGGRCRASQQAGQPASEPVGPARSGSGRTWTTGRKLTHV